MRLLLSTPTAFMVVSQNGTSLRSTASASAAVVLIQRPPSAARAYLIESRWPIEGLRLEGRDFAFKGRGFGPGEMTWKVPGPGRYQITAEDGERDVTELPADLRAVPP